MCIAIRNRMHKNAPSPRWSRSSARCRCRAGVLQFDQAVTAEILIIFWYDKTKMVSECRLSWATMLRTKLRKSWPSKYEPSCDIIWGTSTRSETFTFPIIKSFHYKSWGQRGFEQMFLLQTFFCLQYVHKSTTKSNTVHLFFTQHNPSAQSQNVYIPVSQKT